MASFKIISKSEEDTSKIAACMAPILEFGDVLILSGDLAAGKTFFSKAFARHLGYTDLVTSPTFTIAHFYEIKGGNILHIDAYRLEDINDFRDLGLEDFLSDSIALIEWGEKIVEDFEEYISIQFDYLNGNPDQRELNFSYTGERYTTKFALLEAKLKEEL